jgi:hypothetical protein
MRLVSTALLAFALVLMALAFGVEAPFAATNPFEAFDRTPPATEPHPNAPVEIAELDESEREAIDAARQDLAAGVEMRHRTETDRSEAQARFARAQADFEAALLDLMHAEMDLQKAVESRRGAAARKADARLRESRKAALAAEARLTEARRSLQTALDAVDASEASLSRARNALRKVTERIAERARIRAHLPTLAAATEPTATL